MYNLTSSAQRLLYISKITIMEQYCIWISILTPTKTLLSGLNRLLPLALCRSQYPRNSNLTMALSLGLMTPCATRTVSPGSNQLVGYLLGSVLDI